MKVSPTKLQFKQKSTRPSSKSRFRPQRQRFATFARNLDKELYLQQAPQPPYPQPQSGNTVGKFVGGLIFLALGGAWLFRFIKNRREKQILDEEIIEQDGASEDEGAYHLTVSRTRQAVHIQKAIMYMKRAMNARSLVELECALQENQINRRPYLNVYSEHDELEDLYRLFLRNSVVPRDFGVLLQLRTMLGLTEMDAVHLENEVGREQSYAI